MRARASARLRRGLGVAAVLVALLLLASLPGLPLGTSTRPSAEPAARTAPPPGIRSPTASAVPASPLARPAVAVPTWVNVSRPGSGAPPPVSGGSAAYDPAEHATLLFGGCSAVQCPGNETWAFSDGAWTNLTPPRGSPPARYDAGMDYDPAMGGVLLFGGRTASGSALNDTWLFRAGLWTNLSYVSAAPPARFAASLAYDPEPEANGSVLYGGCLGSGFSTACLYNDTWVWHPGSGWTLLTSTNPGPFAGFGAMAYDPVDGGLLLFGGCEGFLCAGISNQTWQFYGGEWSELTPSSFPVARIGAGLAYDPLDRGMLLFGGENGSGYLADTWVFAGDAWSELAPPTGPSARAFYGLAPDPTNSTVLLVGGSTAGPTENDTWIYEVPNSVSLVASSSSAEISQPVGFTASVSGGIAPYRVVIDFGDGTRAVASGNGPTFEVEHRYAFRGDFSATTLVSDADGGNASAAAAPVTVRDGPSVAVGATPSVADVGAPVSFNTSATGGSMPFTYAWRFGDGATSTGAAASHAYAAPGTYPVAVGLTDALGGTANASLAVTVVADPSVTLSASPGAANTTTPIRLHAAVSGGVPPFSYAWRFGDGAGSAIPSPAHTYPKAGTYTVRLWANDSSGGSASASLSVTVSPATNGTSPPPSGGSNRTTTVTEPPPSYFWPVVGVLVAVGIVGSILLLRSGRARSGP